MNKPNAAAVKQRPKLPAESARSTYNRAAGCFKLRVGSMGIILACTRDRVKTIIKSSACTCSYSWQGSTHKQGENFDIKAVR